MVTVLPPDGDGPDPAPPPMDRRRFIAVVATCALVAAGAIAWLLAAREAPDPAALPLGQASDFPLGSVTEVTLDVGHSDPFGVEGPGNEITGVEEGTQARIFIVNDPNQGLLALSEQSPWLGCRVLEVTAQDAADLVGTVPAGFEHGFGDPCHGGLFSLDGRHLSGPGARGLDRFPVAYLPDGTVVVDLTKMAMTLSVVVDATTTTAESTSESDAHRVRIADLITELEAARQQVTELGIEVDPVAYAPVLGCEQSIRNPDDWQADGFFLGPLAFVRLDERLPAPGWNEVFAVVEPSDAVTLVVPASERNRYSLIWNPETWRETAGYTVADGEPAVTLQACDDRASAFIGGFVSNAALCAPLDVYFAEDPEPHRVGLPFGGAECTEVEHGFSIPDAGLLPDVTGMTLRNARLELRLVGADPAVADGESQTPDSMVWAQEPNDGRTYPAGTIVGLRTCRPADAVVATYQARLEGTGISLTNAWMTLSVEENLESWYFVSARVSGGSSDGDIATWAMPGFSGSVDSVNTPNLSIPANEVSESFDFRYRVVDAQDYGLSAWMDLAGADESQRCVEVS